MFVCSSRGGPDNYYQWINAETGLVVHNGSTLVIQSVSFNNSGEYVCEASNEAGSGSNSSTLNSMLICPISTCAFNVHFFPGPVYITKGPTDVIAALNMSIHFSCEFKSRSPVTAQWLFNDIAIENAVVVTTPNQSTLYLNELTLSQSGNYTCLLTNGIVESVEATGLLIIGKLFIYMYYTFYFVVFFRSTGSYNQSS